MSSGRLPLDSRLMEILLALEETGSASDTAKRLGRVPHAITRELQRLARDTGAVVKRDGRWLITPQGRALNQVTRETLRGQRSILESQRLKILVCGAVVFALDRAIYAFAAEHNLEVSLQLSAEDSDQETCDACLTTSVTKREGFLRKIGDLDFLFVAKDKTLPLEPADAATLAARSALDLVRDSIALSYGDKPGWLPEGMLREQAKTAGIEPALESHRVRVDVLFWHRIENPQARSILNRFAEKVSARLRQAQGRYRTFRHG